MSATKQEAALGAGQIEELRQAAYDSGYADAASVSRPCRPAWGVTVEHVPAESMVRHGRESQTTFAAVGTMPGDGLDARTATLIREDRIEVDELTGAVWTAAGETTVYLNLLELPLKELPNLIMALVELQAAEAEIPGAVPAVREVIASLLP